MNRLRAALALLLLALLPATAMAQHPRHVRVELGGAVDMRALLEGGFDIVHARPGTFAEVYAWPGDEARLAAMGARVTLLDEDPGRTQARRTQREIESLRASGLWPERGPSRDGVQAAPPFGAGGFAGWFTLDEIKAKLEDFIANDPDDVVADKVDTVGWTLQGRPVWGLQLGKVVGDPDPRPVVFYNALTHAREPGGMTALLFFADDLLSQYATNPVARALLANRRLYLVPVVNPDGYVFNKRIYDSTGSFGMWRKNLRDNNGNGSSGSGDGVDINRNYGDHWGYNNVGSSGTPSSETYRGTAPFSEPETQVQRDLVIAKRPTLGISFHTYSDLFVHPYGWTTAGTPDSAKFQEWSDEMTLDNGYTAGAGPRILYEVNGEFNDWTYGDTLSKPRAFTWTPEVGTPGDGFWPPQSRIVPLAREMLRACWVLAQCGGSWLKVQDVQIAEGALNAGHAAHLALLARNVGARPTPGPVTATLLPLDPGVEVLSGSITYPAMPALSNAPADAGGTFWVAAHDTVTPGRLVRFLADWSDEAGLLSRDTVHVLVGTPTVLLNDPATNLIYWNVAVGGWGVVSWDNVNHPSRYFADSPTSRYAASANNAMTLRNPLDLSSGVHAWLLFENRWAFESDYDAGLIEASRDNSTWTALRSVGTTTSATSSAAGGGKPVFDGTRWRWRADRVDLSAFAGGATHDSVWIRFRVVADGGSEFDGLNADSLRVLLFDPAMQPLPVAVQPGAGPSLEFAAPTPNPARGATRFAFSLPRAGNVRLEILDVSGRRVRTLAARAMGAGRYAHGWDLRDDGGRPVAPGVYLAHLVTPDGARTRRVVLLP
jgi:hypothetical protein